MTQTPTGLVAATPRLRPHRAPSVPAPVDPGVGEAEPKARRRKPPVQVGGVAREQKLPADTQAIVAAVRGKTKQQSADLTERLKALVVQLREIHREHAEELVPIGVQMDRPMLDDFIEIGRRMLAGRSMS